MTNSPGFIIFMHMIYLPAVKRYCKEYWKIQNYEEALSSDETYECHHILELTINGEFAHNIKDLKRLHMYYNRPYFELIFISSKEHARLHAKSRSMCTNSLNSKWHTGRKLSEEHKRHIGIKSKGHIVSEDQRRRTALTRKGTKLQLGSDNKYHWVKINK